MANKKYVEDCGGIKPLPLLQRDGDKKTKAAGAKKSSTKKKK